MINNKETIRAEHSVSSKCGKTLDVKAWGQRLGDGRHMMSYKPWTPKAVWEWILGCLYAMLRRTNCVFLSGSWGGEWWWAWGPWWSGCKSWLWSTLAMLRVQVTVKVLALLKCVSLRPPKTTQLHILISWCLTVSLIHPGWLPFRVPMYDDVFQETPRAVWESYPHQLTCHHGDHQDR